MEKSSNIIFNNSLFFGISKTEFSSMIDCLGASEKIYNKNQSIINEGDPINFVGIVLKGSLKIIKTDYNGNEIIIADISEGDIFAEVFACAEIHYSPVSIISSSESNILFFDYRKIISGCGTSCVFHQKLISNMLNIVARKCLYLNRKIDIISKKSLRDKILTYFYYESGGQSKFSISLNRGEMANFLSADRSALSNELSKMKKDGIIDYHKNKFELHI